MEQKISPDEKITLNALSSVDPFARPGRPAQKIKQPVVPPSGRDFSNYDEPIARKAEVPAVEKKPKAAKVKPQKRLQQMEEAPVVEQRAPNPIQESRSTEGMPSYRCEFAGRDIFVGFPCYKTTNPVTAFAMIAMALDFGRDKIRFDMSIGDAMVYHSRNRLAQLFLDTDAKYLLMIDDDIIPCIGRPQWMRSTVQSARDVPDAALQRHVLHRLIGSGKTLVGGAYFGRQENGTIMCSDRSLYPRAKAYEDAVVPVDWVGTGCLLIHRKVFSDIMVKYPELKGANPNDPFDFFHPINSNMGEDVSFCHRAKQAGHQCHVDLGLPVYHVGYKTY